MNNSNVDNRINFFIFYRNTRNFCHVIDAKDILVTVLGRSILKDQISLFSGAKVPGPVKLYLKQLGK